MHTIIEQLNWRYATKKYDTNKKISAEDLQTLKEAVRLSASSMGLQPYKVLSVESDELRALLREKSYGQPQVTDASNFFIFAAQNTVETTHIDAYIDLIAETRGVRTEDLKGYSDYLRNATLNLPSEQASLWNAKQAYIALGTLLTAAAALNIDATPMEGFDTAAYSEALGLTDHTAVVVCALGYRSPEDANQHHPKVRKPVATLFETI